MEAAQIARCHSRLLKRTRRALPQTLQCPQRLRYQQIRSLSNPITKPAPPSPPAIERPDAKAQTFNPKPLSRSIGFPDPPRAGENTGVDTRSWRQRRDDFFNYDKHLERRKELYIPSIPVFFHVYLANHVLPHPAQKPSQPPTSANGPTCASQRESLSSPHQPSSARTAPSTFPISAAKLSPQHRNEPLATPRRFSQIRCR